MRLIAAVVVLAVAAVVPAAAQAAPVRGGAQVHELRAQLREARASLRLTSRALRDTQRSLAAAQATIGQLERDVALRTAERDAAIARSQRRTGLATAVAQVRRAVAYVQPYDPQSPREALIAHAAMNYVTGHVTAPGYGYFNVILKTPLAASAEAALQTGAGICGHAALTLAAILHRFDIPVRSVQFYFADGINNHIAVEAFYGGAWHYYDPTWGAYYLDGTNVLSIAEARGRADARSLLRQDDTLFWRSVQRRRGVPELGAETDAQTRVEIDKQKFPD